MFDFLNVIKAFFLGIIEGVTEWLPVSSTGHMLVFNGLWPMQNVSEGFWESFLYMIQLGAILAVVILFWKRMWPFRRPGKAVADAAADPQSGGKAPAWINMPIVKTWLKVVVACVPGAPYQSFGCCAMIGPLDSVSVKRTSAVPPNRSVTTQA